MGHSRTQWQPAELLVAAGLLLLCGLAATLTTAGCAGDRARADVLAPTLDAVTPAIVADAERAEGADAAVIEQFQTAVSDREWSTAKLLWPEIEAWAQASIAADVDDRSLGPTAAESLQERLRVYGEQLSKMR